MTERQIEEFAKLCMDMGKLIFVSLVVGFAQIKSNPISFIAISTFGLTFCMAFFTMGLKLFERL